jgi:hypothetical protein
MASIEQTQFYPTTLLASGSSAAGAAVTATATAITTTFKYVVTAICISATAAPAAAVLAELKISGGATKLPLRLPASAYAPIFINFAQSPLEFEAGEEPELTVPAHGGAVIVSVAIFGRKVRV